MGEILVGGEKDFRQKIRQIQRNCKEMWPLF